MQTKTLFAAAMALSLTVPHPASALTIFVTNETIYRLLRLRLQYRGGRHSPYGPHMDGFQPDARAHFVRWLVREGKLNEGL